MLCILNIHLYVNSKIKIDWVYVSYLHFAYHNNAIVIIINSSLFIVLITYADEKLMPQKVYYTANSFVVKGNWVGST